MTGWLLVALGFVIFVVVVWAVCRTIINAGEWFGRRWPL